MVELDPICKSFQSATVLKLVEQAGDLVKQGNYSQARDILRQALQIESTNTHARSLLEKVNLELKRALIRPKAQQFVEKGLELLAQGKIQEAKVEAENALKLDTNFEAAQELKQRVQEELDRFQLIAEYLDTAKLRLAEGLPEMAEEPLAKVLQLEPANKTAKALQEQVERDKLQRERRLRLTGPAATGPQSVDRAELQAVHRDSDRIERGISARGGSSPAARSRARRLCGTKQTPGFGTSERHFGRGPPRRMHRAAAGPAKRISRGPRDKRFVGKRPGRSGEPAATEIPGRSSTAVYRPAI